MFQTKLKLLAAATGAAGQAVAADFALLNTTASVGFAVEIGVQVGGKSPYLAIFNSPALVRGVISFNINSVDAFRIQVGIVGSNLVVDLSPDGYNWFQVYSEVFSSGSLAGNYPNQLKLILNSTANASNAGLVAWDYVRKIA